MHPLNSGLTTAGLLLLAPSMASAHGEGITAISLYHYLSSPDHVMVLGILIATCVGVGAWAIGSSLKMARQRQDGVSATFSPELADLTIYVIDVAEGEKIPRKGGPDITKSDLLIINKIDLAPYVGADLSVMERDTKRMRPNSPYVFNNLKIKQGLEEIVSFIIDEGMLSA